MKTLQTLALLFSVSLLHAEDWKPDPGFKSLFNGKDLTGWCFRGQMEYRHIQILER